MTRRHSRMCLLGVCMTTYNIKGFNTPKNHQKGAWLGIFQPKWQNYKIVISLAGNIGSTPNFDVVIEPHSRLRGWSRITKFIFKIADGRHIAEYWKRYNSPTNGPIWMKLAWSHPIMSPICPPCCGCHGNGRCLAITPRSNPWTEFNHLWLKWRVVIQGCAFWGFEWPPTILRGSKPPKPPKGGVVRHFPAKVAK